ncbi:hypothetical protein ACIO93_09430 [Streptomyces sp. NPDC087903]|uniref:hypothetical protein n=1 Tax=Streptomyces sp. NPDC087903 TaxID=3365819 RepID=UPI00380FB073
MTGLMTGRFRRPHVDGVALQSMPDDLAEELGRSVVVDDPQVRVISSSRRFGDEDPARVHSLLQGCVEKFPVEEVAGAGR